MGRPSKLTEQVIERLEEAFGLGQVSIVSACTYAGISEPTYHRWMAEGKEEGSGPKREFRERMEKVRAQVELMYLGVIRQAALDGNWTAAAWWLERVKPRDYGRKTQVEVITMDAIEAEIARLEAQLGDQEGAEI